MSLSGSLEVKNAADTQEREAHKQLEGSVLHLQQLEPQIGIPCLLLPRFCVLSDFRILRRAHILVRWCQRMVHHPGAIRLLRVLRAVRERRTGAKRSNQNLLPVGVFDTRHDGETLFKIRYR